VVASQAGVALICGYLMPAPSLAPTPNCHHSSVHRVAPRNRFFIHLQ
jgi:hypothetical protein